MFVLKTQTSPDNFVTQIYQRYSFSKTRPEIFLSSEIRAFSPAVFILHCNCDYIEWIRSLARLCHRSRPKIYFGLRALATSLNKTIMKAEFDRRELIGDSWSPADELWDFIVYSMAVQESNAQAVGRPVPPTKAHWSMKSFAGPPFAKSSSMRALVATSSRRGYLLSTYSCLSWSILLLKRRTIPAIFTIRVNIFQKIVALLFVKFQFDKCFCFREKVTKNWKAAWGFYCKIFNDKNLYKYNRCIQHILLQLIKIPNEQYIFY